MSLLDKLRRNYVAGSLSMLLAAACGDSTQKGEEGSGDSTEEGVCTRYFGSCSTPSVNEILESNRGRCSPYMVPGGFVDVGDCRGSGNPRYLDNGLSCEEDFTPNNEFCLDDCTPSIVIDACDAACKKEYIDWFLSCWPGNRTFPIDPESVPCLVLYCGVEKNSCWNNYAYMDEPTNQPILDCMIAHGWTDRALR